jgi:hypothetical protein
MCSRAIAPLKMMHRLKHMRPHLEVRGRIQLFEFLDLILWSSQQEKLEVNYPRTCETENDLFKVMYNFNRTQFYRSRNDISYRSGRIAGLVHDGVTGRVWYMIV